MTLDDHSIEEVCHPHYLHHNKLKTLIKKNTQYEMSHHFKNTQIKRIQLQPPSYDNYIYIYISPIIHTHTHKTERDHLLYLINQTALAATYIWK